MRIPIEEHKPWPGKVYTFFVVNRRGHIIEGNLPTVEDAWTVIDFLKATDGNINYRIEVDLIPNKKG